MIKKSCKDIFSKQTPKSGSSCKNSLGPNRGGNGENMRKEIEKLLSQLCSRVMVRDLKNRLTRDNDKYRTKQKCRTIQKSRAIHPWPNHHRTRGSQLSRQLFCKRWERWRRRDLKSKTDTCARPKRVANACDRKNTAQSGHTNAAMLLAMHIKDILDAWRPTTSE